MMQKLTTLVLIIIMLPIFSHAQRWKRQRVEYSFGIGATNFLGDLGGRDQIGTNGLMDLEFKATRFSLGLGYRYQLAKKIFVRGNFYYARVSGDDKLTKEPARAARNLNFRSNIVELSVQGEFMLIQPKSSHVSRLRGIKGKGLFSGFQVYALAGFGGIWYDPTGSDGTKTVRLAPLNTEGQGEIGGPKDYSGFTVVIPYGIGIRKTLAGGGGRGGTFTIGLELTMRKTFSDYIDDVSTDYYDSDGLGTAGANYDADAQYFSDPSGQYVNGGFGESQQRGDPNDNDAYMMGIISINYKPARRRRNLPKF